MIRRHWLLMVLLAAGAGLRVLAVLAYQPALLFVDSYGYLDNVDELRPDGERPIGYDLILRVLLPWGGLRFVAVAQHLLGLGIALAIYRLLLHHGARRWLAAVAAAPVLLDAYQVQIEHNVMSDVWLQALLVAIVAVLTWPGIPGPGPAAVAGCLIGFAVMVRLVGVTMVVPALAYLVIVGSPWGSWAGWRRIGIRVGALTLGFVVVLAGYAGYFHQVTGSWGLSGAGGTVLYGRAAVIADCPRLTAGTWERALCPAEPRAERYGVDYYAHHYAAQHDAAQHDAAPPDPVWLPPDELLEQVQRSFAFQVFANQPLDLSGAVLTDFGKGFRPVRADAAGDVPVARWQFQTAYPYWWPGLDPAYALAVAMQFGGSPITVRPGLAALLRGYQLTVGYTPGPLLGLALVVGLLGGFGLGRARRCGIRAATLLVSGLGITVLLTAAVFEFSWRYQLPGLVLLPLAGVLGVTALTEPLRRPGPRRTRRRLPLAPYPDPVDVASVREFLRTEGEVRFAPAVVVIAAYNEEAGIGAVLTAVPSSCCGLSVDTLVVVDGCTDGTTEVARRHGARVCVAVTNRGQGAALRLGYALARRGGARYLVTTDADGQYDLSELPLLLQPLIDDEADFVTGSRRLGRQETSDPVRHLGVRVFAWLAGVLTGRRLTDTSFGFRAMKAELTGVVTLAQPQYQASELLLGVISHGYRVLEQPMTMLARTAGKTKKGNNLVYGTRYARVLVGTWWRERSVRRVSAVSAPAGPSPGANTSRSSSVNLSRKNST